jgi:transcriptional regulator with XRE-family HTH domain
MNIVINEELQKYIDPLTPNEYAALERSLLAEGCRDALVLWGEVLVDGHNRYEICRKYDIAFKTVRNDSFKSLDDVLLWMIDNQLGRRSVSDFQRGMLALRKRDIVAARTKADARPAKSSETEAPEAAQGAETSDAGDPPWDTADSAPIKTRQDIARAAGISSATIGQIERIRKTAAPELVQAVRAGAISINAAAAVASLPSADQVNAVAGGKKELREAAKKVREQKAATRSPRDASQDDELAAQTLPLVEGQENPLTATLRREIAALQSRVSQLTQDNQALRAELALLKGAAA